MTKRKFYKKTYTVEILSETPFPEPMCLGCALHEAEEGDYSARITENPPSEIDGAEAAQSLIAHSSDPAFFSLTADGEDNEEAGEDPDEDDPDYFQCANCEFTAPYENLPTAKDLFERIEVGDIFTDVECPECGSLCFPLDEEDAEPKGDGDLDDFLKA
jgi:hypothetical protein